MKQIVMAVMQVKIVHLLIYIYNRRLGYWKPSGVIIEQHNLSNNMFGNILYQSPVRKNIQTWR